MRADLVEDTVTTALVSPAVRGPARSGDVAPLLEKTAQDRGGWTLVRSLENRQPRASEELAHRHCFNQATHLRSFPRTPQNNGWFEQAIGELKAACGPLGPPPRNARLPRRGA